MKQIGTSPINVYKPELYWFEEADRFLSQNLVDAPGVFLNLIDEPNEIENIQNSSHNENTQNSSHNDDNPTDVISVLYLPENLRNLSDLMTSIFTGVCEQFHG